MIRVSNIFGKVGLKNNKDGSFDVLHKLYRERLSLDRRQIFEENYLEVAKFIAKTLLPIQFKVEEIYKKRIDEKTQEQLYLVKFKNEDNNVYLNETCFDQPFAYNKRQGLTTRSLHFADSKITQADDQTIKVLQKKSKIPKQIYQFRQKLFPNTVSVI